MGRLHGGIVVGMLGCLLWIFLPGIAVGQWYSSGTLHHASGLEWGLDHGIGHFMLFEVDSEARAPAPPMPKSP